MEEQTFLEYKAEVGANVMPCPNLTREEYRGMLRVKKGIKEEGWHLSATDK